MNNQDRNIRTLIVCFIIALVALVPLRIMESQDYMIQEAAVLGEETYNDKEELYLEEDYIEEEYTAENLSILQNKIVLHENEIDSFTADATNVETKITQLQN